MRIASLGLAMIVACSGGSGDASDDDSGGDGGPVECNPDPCDFSACGVVYQDGCTPIDCGMCRYDGALIDPQGHSASLHGGRPPTVAYVVPTGVDHEVRVARLNADDLTWTVEPVRSLSVDGGGDTATAVWRGIDGTTWVAWNDSDGNVHTASRNQVASWTYQLSVARGVRPRFAELGDGTMVLAYAGVQPGGIQIRRHSGIAWGPATAIPDDAVDLAIAARTDDLHVAWRNRAQQARYARSSDGGPFTVEDLETDGGFASATIGLAIDFEDLPHVAYSRGDDTTVHAVKRDGTWERTALGVGFGHGGGTALAIGNHVHIAYVNAFGVQVADDSLRGGFQEQTVFNQCDDGPLWAQTDDGNRLNLLHSCDARPGVYWRRRGFFERFPDGWEASCTAVADILATTACACAADPQRPACCITSGTGRHCSSGETPRALAYAAVCGDPTIDPAILPDCAVAASDATCMSDGEAGTVVVPTACVP